MQTVKNTIAENFGFSGAQELASPENQFSVDDCPNLEGKVALITGGSEGIGFGAAYTFLKHGLKKLFIISVSKEVMDGAKKVIGDELGQDVADRIVWFECDLADWPKVVDIAKQVTEQTDRLDILVNNSARGIMTYQLGENGLERHFSINHVAHVTLTSHLLPLLKKTAEKDTVRISIQSSNAHQGAPSDTKFESLDEINRDLGANGQYGRSKLANLLYARWLTRNLTSKHPNIIVNATHPGFVSTKQSIQDIHEPFPILGFGMSHIMEPFKKDQFQGATPTVYAATTATEGGNYICPPKVHEPGSSMSQDAALGDQLMKLTFEIVEEKFHVKSMGCPLTAA